MDYIDNRIIDTILKYINLRKQNEKHEKMKIH